MILSSFWILGLAVVFVVLVPSVGYGWAYRGWGPPLPSFVQQRRSAHAKARGSALPVDHRAWGRAGDFVWVALFIGVLWAFSGIWLH